MSFTKADLRYKLRAMRSQINSAAQETAANALREHACGLEEFATAKNIAVYWPNDGEISTLPIIHEILAQNKNCFLPVLLLDQRQQLAFASYTAQTPLLKNRYDICEPDLTTAYFCGLEDLNIIFVPLVAFDLKGRRLGRGGGFYDATFAHLHQIKHSKWPKLIGLAYECQKVDNLPVDSWDWQLNMVVTENGILRF